MTNTPPPSIRLEAAGEIATLWFDAPDRPVNTFSAAVFDDLADALDSIEAMSPAPRQVRLASAKDGTFIAGADLKAIRDLPDEQLDALLKRGQSLFSRIETLPMQTVALINGAALGGGLEAALACDYRIAAADPAGRKTIGLPEITLGLIPGWGGTVRLPLRIGVRSAAELMLTGKALSPEEASQLGIVDRVVEAAEMVEAATGFLETPPAHATADLSSWKGELAQADDDAGPIPPDRQHAARLMREALNAWLEAAQGGLDAGTRVGLDRERRGLIDGRNSESGKALIAAFFEKRKKR